MKHIKILSYQGDSLLQTMGKIDADHWVVTVGLNCWGRGETIAESLKNCQANAWSSRKGTFVTRIAPRDGFGVDPVDGSISWSQKHDAKNCDICSVGKGIVVSV